MPWGLLVVAHLVIDALRLDLLLCLPHAGNLWPGVHNGGHGVVVDVPTAPGQQLHTCHAILLSLLAQQTADGDI